MKNDDMMLKTEFITMINDRAREKSLQQSKREVRGEYYPSSAKEKKKIIEAAKASIIGVCAAIGVISVVGTIGTSDFMDEVRKEVNETHVEQNLIGGDYDTVSDYDPMFVQYVNGLNDYELNKLYDETSKTMDGVEANIVEEVVDEMEESYLENNVRGI